MKTESSNVTEGQNSASDHLSSSITYCYPVSSSPLPIFLCVAGEVHPLCGGKLCMYCCSHHQQGSGEARSSKEGLLSQLFL